MKILAAEDDYLTRFLLVGTLESLGHEVVACASGTEAWEKAQSEMIDLVVSDWRLPGLDGMELCRRIRGRDCAEFVYFILATAGSVTEGDEALAVDAGVDDFLPKPLNTPELRNRLRIASRLIESTRQLRRLEALLKGAPLTAAGQGMEKTGQIGPNKYRT